MADKRKAPASKPAPASSAKKSKYVPKRMPRTIGTGLKTRVKKGNYTLAPKSLINAKFFDARIPRTACISPSPTLGNYTPLSLKARNTMLLGTGESKLLVLNFSRNGIACAIVHDLLGSPHHGDVELLPFDELLSDPPQSLRGSRKTITVGCSTANQDVAGAVHACMVPQSIQLTPHASKAGAIDAASTKSLSDIATSSTNSKQFSTLQFQKNPAFSLGFASYVLGAAYEPFAGMETGTLTDPQKNANVAKWLDNLQTGAMSTLVMKFASSGSSQSFELGVYEQVASRYPANHLLAGLQRMAGGMPVKGFQAANAQQASQAIPVPPGTP